MFKSDHEFSMESDIEEADAQPIKRARTAKKGGFICSLTSVVFVSWLKWIN